MWYVRCADTKRTLSTHFARNSSQLLNYSILHRNFYLLFDEIIDNVIVVGRSIWTIQVAINSVRNVLLPIPSYMWSLFCTECRWYVCMLCMAEHIILYLVMHTFTAELIHAYHFIALSSPIFILELDMIVCIMEKGVAPFGQVNFNKAINE